MHDENEISKFHKLEDEAEALERKLAEKLHEVEEEIEKIEEHGPFEVLVNNKKVTVVGHDHSGLEIKGAAIASGVRIQLDYVLSEELSHGRSRIIGDEQRIRVEKGARFEAIPNDDHS